MRELEDQAARDQVDLAKQSDRLQSQQEQLARLKDEQQQRQQQSDEADRRLQNSIAKLRQVTLHLLNTRAVLDGNTSSRNSGSRRWIASRPKKRNCASAAGN